MMFDSFQGYRPPLFQVRLDEYDSLFAYIHNFHWIQQDGSRFHQLHLGTGQINNRQDIISLHGKIHILWSAARLLDEVSGIQRSAGNADYPAIIGD